jgi:hypothetical protein
MYHYILSHMYHKPIRSIIVGPPQSGVTAVCTAITARHGLAHVDLRRCLNALLLECGRTILAKPTAAQLKADNASTKSSKDSHKGNKNQDKGGGTVAKASQTPEKGKKGAAATTANTVQSPAVTQQPKSSVEELVADAVTLLNYINSANDSSPKIGEAEYPLVDDVTLTSVIPVEAATAVIIRLIQSATFARRGYLCDGYAAALLLAQASSTTLSSTTSEYSTGNTATAPVAVTASISPQQIIYITATKANLLQQWDALEMQQQQQQQQPTSTTTTTTAAAAAANTAAQLQQQQSKRAAYAQSLDQYFEKEGLVSDDNNNNDTTLQSIDDSAAVATSDGADNNLSVKSFNTVPSTAAVLSAKLKAQLVEANAMQGDAATLVDVIEKHVTSGTSSKAYDTVLKKTNSSLVYEYVTQMMMYNIDNTSLDNPLANCPNDDGAASKSTPNEERQVSLLVDLYTDGTTFDSLFQSS